MMCSAKGIMQKGFPLGGKKTASSLSRKRLMRGDKSPPKQRLQSLTRSTRPRSAASRPVGGVDRRILKSPQKTLRALWGVQQWMANGFSASRIQNRMFAPSKNALKVLREVWRELSQKFPPSHPRVPSHPFLTEPCSGTPACGGAWGDRRRRRACRPRRFFRCP